MFRPELCRSEPELVGALSSPAQDTEDGREPRSEIKKSCLSALGLSRGSALGFSRALSRFRGLAFGKKSFHEVMRICPKPDSTMFAPTPGPTLAQRHPTRVHVGLGPRAPLGKVIRIAKRSPHDQRRPRKFWLVQRRVQLAAFSSPWPSRDHATELSQHIDATTITGGTEEESHAARTHTLPGEHDTHRFRSADDPSGARPLKAGPNGDAR